MSLTSVGRATLRKMIDSSPDGAASVVFRLFDSAEYDPSTGETVASATTVTRTCFLMRGDDKQGRDGVPKKTYIVVLEDGALPRMPANQDEATIDGARFVVCDVKTDPMKVQLKIEVEQA